MRTIGVGAKIAISLLALTSFSILFLSNYSVYAEESSVSTATVTINQSCSMVGTTNTAHTATLANGTYSGSNYPNGIGQTTLKVFCNDNAGFAIYAIGYTGNEYGNTKLHNDTLGTANDINTGIYTSNNTVNSTWSMKLTSVSGTYAPTIADGTNNTENFTTWHEIPTEYTKVAYRTSTTDADNNGQGTGSSLTTTYDAYVSATQPAGTYIGQVKYTLVHPNMTNNENKPVAPLSASACPKNSICYAPNVPDIIGSMDSISSTKITSSQTAGVQSATANSTVMLIAPNYSRPGYGFAGWSTDFETTSSSIIYGPNETISTNPNDEGGLDISSHGTILYPVWIASAGNLQGWIGCSSLTTAPTDGSRATLASMTALTDARDNNVYAVAKLADGKCWMTENLRLDNTATISTTNTRNPLTTNNSVTLKIDYTNNIIADHLASSNNAWCEDKEDFCYDQTMLNTNNTNRTLDASRTGTGSNTYYQWYSYGNYYNWYSATAGNGTYDFDTKNDSVSGDLCPTGWRLPIGGQITVNTTGDFYILTKILMGGIEPNNPYGGYAYYQGTVDGVNIADKASKSLRFFPTNLVNSGYFSGSTAYYRNAHGYYWTGSVYDNDYAFYTWLYTGYVYPGTRYFSKSWGFSVRCIAQ